MAEKAETLNQWQERERRLRAVMQWIKTDIRVHGEPYDREKIDALIRDTFGMDKRYRRTAMIDAAEKLMRGEISMQELKGGRPREFVRRVDVDDLQALSDALKEVNVYIFNKPQLRALEPLFSAVKDIRAKYLD